MSRRSVTECNTAPYAVPAVRDDSTSSTSSARAVAAATWSPRSKRPWAQERRSENGVVVFMRPTTPPALPAFRAPGAPASLVVRWALLLEPAVADAGSGGPLAPPEVELAAAGFEGRSRLVGPHVAGPVGGGTRALAEHPAALALALRSGRRCRCRLLD